MHGKFHESFIDNRISDFGWKYHLVVDVDILFGKYGG
jgi:hypothetical protein